MLRWTRTLVAAVLVSSGPSAALAGNGQGTAETSSATTRLEDRAGVFLEDLHPNDPPSCPQKLWIGPHPTDLPARSEAGACVQLAVDLCVYQASRERQANRCLRRVSRRLLGNARALPKAALACRAEIVAPTVEATAIPAGRERAQPIFCRVRPRGPNPPVEECECKIKDFRAVPGDAGRADVSHGLLAELELWRPITLRLRATRGGPVLMRAILILEKVRFGYEGREILGGVPNDYVLGADAELHRSDWQSDVDVEIPVVNVISRTHCKYHTLETALPSGEGRATATLGLKELTDRVRWALEDQLRAFAPPEIEEFGKRYLVTGIHSVSIETQTEYRVNLDAVCLPGAWRRTYFRIRQEAVPGGYRLRVP